MSVIEYHNKYPGLHDSLMRASFKHIDRRKRIEAEEGRNPNLLMLFHARMLKHAKGLIKSRERFLSDSQEQLSPKTVLVHKRWIDFLRHKGIRIEFELLSTARSSKPSANTLILGFENLPLMPDRQARPRSSAPGSRAATTDSGCGGPDEPDPDPDPERPYIALGIDYKATTPAGPPAPVSLRFFSLYRIEMRHCHEGNRTDHPEP